MKIQKQKKRKKMLRSCGQDTYLGVLIHSSLVSSLVMCSFFCSRVLIQNEKIGRLVMEIVNLFSKKRERAKYP